MALHETAVFIDQPIADVVKHADPSVNAFEMNSDEEIVWLLGGPTVDSAAFAIRSELAAPIEGWTQLLHRAPEDIEALAAALSVLGVRAGDIEVSTDGSGRPLLSVEALKQAMKASRPRRPRRRKRITAPVPRTDPRPDARTWVVIDASGMTLARLASLAAHHLASRTNPEQAASAWYFRVLVVNAEKAHLETGMRKHRLRLHYGDVIDRRLASAFRKDKRAKELMKRHHPDLSTGSVVERLIRDAVKRFLPKNPAGLRAIKNLSIRTSSEAEGDLQTARTSDRTIYMSAQTDPAGRSQRSGRIGPQGDAAEPYRRSPLENAESASRRSA